MDAPARLTVSAVIPVHDAAKYLGAALDSIAAGSRLPDEVVVVDDGSTDGSLDIARAHPIAPRCVRQQNAGIAVSRNRCLSESTGDVIAFLDADDLWTPDKLTVQCAVLEERPDVEVVFGSVRQFRGDDSSSAGEPEAGALPGSSLIRRRAFDATGPFDTEYRVGEFVGWCIRARELSLTAVTIDDVVLLRRLHDTNTGRTARDARSDYARIIKQALDRRRAREST